MHEATLHEQNSFITLTYAPEHLPKRGQLDYPQFQKFLKRARIRQQKLRYYMCGEYGEQNGRPHYHACIFGRDFSRDEYLGQTPSGANLYRSNELERLWPYGQSSIGDVTFESAAYCARYCMQKVTGKNAEAHYRRVDQEGEYQLEPEFGQMSLKPGIGQDFYTKWKTDMYPHDYVIIRGQKHKPPKYYDNLFKRENPDDWERILIEREMEAYHKRSDNTPERLYAKEQVAKARAGFLKRGLE